MRIALVQLALSEQIDDNLAKALFSIERAAAHGAGLICFPELQLSPFFPQYPGQDASKYAMAMDHDMVERLQSACRSSKLVACLNLYLQEANKRFDASPVIDSDGSVLGVSKMVHIVQAPCFFEQDYYTPSDSGFHVFETAVGRVGVVICFDRHYPESIRTCTLRGAQLVVIPTANTKDEPMEKFEWEVRIAAMQNGIFIAMCNRVGLEGNMNFSGESIVVDPNGDVIAAADDSEQILYADIDFALIDQARDNRPYLTLRRPETYVQHPMTNDQIPMTNDQ